MLPRLLPPRELTFVVVAALIGLILAACTLTAPGPATPADSTPAQPPTPALPFEFTDVRGLFEGICFESADDAAGRVFVLRSPEDLSALYDGSDNRGLCRRPIERRVYDFGIVDGRPTRVIAGLWSRATGCTARHDIISASRDDAARSLVITLRLVTDGDCPYELVQPFWIGLSGVPDYDIRLVLE